MLNALLWFGLGLVLLLGGAEALVRGAARLAAAFGISPLIIGLTVVAFGTSSPELAVSIGAAAGGQSDIAVGNIVGSNIFNVLLILGLSAVIAPLTVSQQLIRLDVPVMIGASAGVLALAYNGTVGRPEGVLLLAGLALYLVFLARISRREKAEVRAEYESEYGFPPTARHPRRLLNLALAAIGLALLVVGANWVVNGAVAMARLLGVGELLIGLTIIAAGTSLPEVATSVVAALRGERDIAVGNVVGSNIFNLLAVLGAAAALSPQGLSVSPTVLSFDFPVMIAVAVACLPIFFTGNTVSRWEGVLFLAYYVAYVVFLALSATGHGVLPLFATVMLGFVLPLTAVTLAVIAWRAWQRQR